MNSREINIIEFPSNLGLKKNATEVEPGVKKLPDWLQTFGFHEQINPKKVYRIEPPVYSMEMDEESGVRNADKIAEYAIQQSKLLKERLNEDTFQLILGGDCSILIGNSVALKQKGEFGLFYIDGHTDFIGPELSHTGGAAGMDLAIVTGHGHDKLTDILSEKPYFEEAHVFCVGNREYDEDYVKPIINSGIRYFDLKAVRANGFESTAKKFLELIHQRNLDGFFIHIDVDALNDEIMPAVDSREKDGLTYEEFSELLKPLLSSDKAIGMEVTILDPNLDRDGKYTKEFIKHFLEIFEYGKAST
ncbi:arginase family protein [Sinomicrobium soli]|uniref:arginase family protein n=1 Tax=Sinomicrobium sp. N-1-3-6 TaxID=2219864 RepID=UPI000DCE2845|nr:arginase family protein [Sinomicrobium sp. N-1-3-6]RAV30256.1 arginase family protein [Sinomicrobium sp. N-1-3-6]